MTTRQAPMAEIYDPLSPAQLADPYLVYALARKLEPVFPSRKVAGDDAEVIVVTRYDDVAAVAGDGDLFSSRESLRPVVPIHPGTYEVLRRGYPMAPTTVETDGPAHERTSVPLGKILNPHTGARYEGLISSVAGELIDEMTAGGERQADLIGAVAHQLPFKVILRLFGVPDSDHALIKGWCADWMRFLSMRLGPQEQVQAAQGMQSYFRYMAGLVAERRRHPREDDLVTLLAGHRQPGYEPLDEAELVNNLGGILLAGHVTATTLIGNAVYLLLSLARRSYWEDIVTAPQHIPRMVSEVLRFRTPTKAFFRTATRDTTLGGVKIAEGQLVQLLFGSANHDEDKWDRPDVFDPWAKRPTPLMSFGAGPHRCIGEGLARAEARIALETLTRRLPGLRLADQEYHYLPVVIVHAFQSLLVEW